jgi:two-component sensor histidine kinase
MRCCQNIFFSLLVLLLACNENPVRRGDKKQFQTDSNKVLSYIKKGDSIYAIKSSYNGFSKSLVYYDSAWQIAIQLKDTSLIAEVIFAKGRAYDAMNSNPQKTIDYYSQAAKLYGNFANKQTEALYIKHLVAHAYDKVMDSTNCLHILHQLYSEILPKPDSVKKQMRFTAEMALISTVVGNYSFADTILNKLTKREWIANDSTAYDYLNHYLLTKARIDINAHHRYNSVYLDSVEQVFLNCKNLSDSMFYSSELYGLYKTAGNKAKEVNYLSMNNTFFNKFNNAESVREANDKLSKLEVATAQQQEKAATEKAQHQSIISYLLAALALAIGIFAYIIYKKNKQTKITNELLFQKNQQNELLNKEIHHRVKNNLEMIMSLVYMQQHNSNTPEVKDNLQNIRLRIESIASLHQQLVEQKESVDLKVYVHQLVSNVSHLLGDNKNILTHLEIQSIVTPQSISFPLGLIINEWITNSVKYAQPTTEPLTIFVDIHNGNNQIKVSYRDNGKLQPTIPKKSSMGLDIVNLLVAQMKSTLIKNPLNNFDYQLTIPLNNG